MKPIICKFQFGEKVGNETVLKTYERVIEFPENSPIAFHAINQWGYEVFHQEKLSLKSRIEQLENMLNIAVLTMRGASHTSAATLSDTIASAEDVLNTDTPYATKER